MDPKSGVGETMSSACWLFKLLTRDTDDLRRACFRVRRRVCTKPQMGRMSHENQQDELYYNSEYMVVVSSKHNCHSIFYHLISLLVGTYL